MTRNRFYVGGICFETRDVLSLSSVPDNKIVKGKEYDFIEGPFSSKKAAELYAAGWNISKAEAERQAKQK